MKSFYEIILRSSTNASSSSSSSSPWWTETLLSKGEDLSSLSEEDRKFLNKLRVVDGRTPELKFQNCTGRYMRRVQAAQFHADDVFVLSYMKSGNTWMLSLVYTLIHGIKKVKSSLFVRDAEAPALEYNVFGTGIRKICKQKRPRIIRSHLPLSSLPKSALENRSKMIYVIRDVKDVCVSMYYHMRFFKPASYKDDFSHFYNLFRHGLVPGGNWLDHVTQYWSNQELDILFVTYEEMSKDLRSVTDRVCKYLDLQRSDEDLNQITHIMKFEVMKGIRGLNTTFHLQSIGLRNRNEPKFMRKGIVGDWRNHFTPEMETELNENFLRPLEALRFNFQSQTECE